MSLESVDNRKVFAYGFRHREVIMDEGKNNCFTRDAERHAAWHDAAFRAGLVTHDNERNNPAMDAHFRAVESFLAPICEIGDPVWTATPEWGHLIAAGRTMSPGLRERAVLAGVDAVLATFSLGGDDLWNLVVTGTDFCPESVESVLLAAMHYAINRRIFPERFPDSPDPA